MELLIEARAEIPQGADPGSGPFGSAACSARSTWWRSARWALLGNKQTEGQAAALAVSLDALLSDIRPCRAYPRCEPPLRGPYATDASDAHRAQSAPRSGHGARGVRVGRERSYARPHSDVDSFRRAPRARHYSRRERDACTRRSGIGTPAHPPVPVLPAPALGTPARGCRAVSSGLAPLADRLTPKRLLIVGDGALDYVPFGRFRCHAAVLDSGTHRAVVASSAPARHSRGAGVAVRRRPECPSNAGTVLGTPDTRERGRPGLPGVPRRRRARRSRGDTVQQRAQHEQDGIEGPTDCSLVRLMSAARAEWPAPAAAVHAPGSAPPSLTSLPAARRNQPLSISRLAVRRPRIPTCRRYRILPHRDARLVNSRGTPSCRGIVLVARRREAGARAGRRPAAATRSSTSICRPISSC